MPRQYRKVPPDEWGRNDSIRAAGRSGDKLGRSVECRPQLLVHPYTDLPKLAFQLRMADAERQ